MKLANRREVAVAAIVILLCLAIVTYLWVLPWFGIQGLGTRPRVKVFTLFVNWAGRFTNDESYPRNLNLTGGTTFSYTSPYNAAPFQYTIDSINVTTPGFKIEGTSPPLPVTVLLGTNPNLIVYITCPDSSFNGDVTIYINTS